MPVYVSDFNSASSFGDAILDSLKKVTETVETSPFLGALREDTKEVPVRFLDRTTSEGATGTYNFKTGEVEVTAAINRYVRKPKEVATTLVHELTHAAQNLPSSRTARDRQDASIRGVAKSLGYSAEESKQIIKDLEDADIFYSLNEPAAHLVPAHYLGTEGSKDGVKEFITKYPEFSKRYAEVNSQPNRSIPKHYKGVPELSAAEYLLNKVFGLQFEEDRILPKFKGR